MRAKIIADVFVVAVIFSGFIWLSINSYSPTVGIKAFVVRGISGMAVWLLCVAIGYVIIRWIHSGKR